MNNKTKIFSKEELDQRNLGLVEISAILEKHNIDYFLTDGTLLGAVREGDFIPWDWDVEITVLTESIFHKVAVILEEVKKDGFLFSSIIQSKSNFKLNVKKYDCKYSLNGLVENDEYMFRDAYRYPKNFFLKKSNISFRGRNYPTVSDIEKYLVFQYGDWKKPPKDPFNKKEYLTKEVRRDSKFIKRLNAFLAIKIQEIKKKTISYLKEKGYEKSNRELNFCFMYLSALREGSTVIEIGSSDCSETTFALNHVNSPKNLEIHIIEPSKKNIKICEQVLKKNTDKTHRVSFTNAAISERTGVDTFYISSQRPNLNSLEKLPHHDSKIDINTTTLADFLASRNITSKLLIKMDIEGREVSILNSSIETLKVLNKVYILLEIHPFVYSVHNSFEETIKGLFSIGFDPLIVESAGVPIPKMFKENNLKPFKIQNNRGMYKEVSKSFVLNYATRNTQDYIDDENLSLKQIRSILFYKQ